MPVNSFRNTRLNKDLDEMNAVFALAWGVVFKRLGVLRDGNASF